jgi:putative hydroxymethylpyrimidine transport system permease protein
MSIGGAWRGLVVAAGLIMLWQGFVWVTDVPPFLLPSPGRVAIVLWDRGDIILGHAAVTLSQILLGLLIGTLGGVLTALLLAAFAPARRWLLPVLLVSQAIPVFAIAPLLTLWLGFGMASKVAMAAIIIFFPVASAFQDGLRRTDPGWVELARSMGASRAAILFRLRVPAALPALASGLRVATAVAPIGAVVGEWVGASAGLGFLMLHANARSQADMMFAALAVLAAIALALWFLMDAALRAALPWSRETYPDEESRP